MAEEIPQSHQVMLFWAGLRGAVGVALAAGLTGPNGLALQATVLVVVVLTVIIFGGTTARMLEIMGIRTGVVEEIDSDDEFDIETATNGTYYKSAGNAVGYAPQRSSNNIHALNKTNGRTNFDGYSSGNSRSPPVRPTAATSRANSVAGQREREAQQNLLAGSDGSPSYDELDYSDSDLPPAAKRRSPKRRPSPPQGENVWPPQGTAANGTTGGGGGDDAHRSENQMSASGAISQLFSGTSDEQAAWFTQLDEGFIKPKLLLDQNQKGRGGGGGV